MKKLLTIGTLFLALTIGTVFSANAWNGAWYTCVPNQCSQTIVIFDDYNSCMQYKRNMGWRYKNCVPYR